MSRKLNAGCLQQSSMLHGTHLVLSAVTQMVAGILRPSSTPYSALALRMDLTTDCKASNCCRASVSTGPEEEGQAALINASPAQRTILKHDLLCGQQLQGSCKSCIIVWTASTRHPTMICCLESTYRVTADVMALRLSGLSNLHTTGVQETEVLHQHGHTFLVSIAELTCTCRYVRCFMNIRTYGYRGMLMEVSQAI